MKSNHDPFISLTSLSFLKIQSLTSARAIEDVNGHIYDDHVIVIYTHIPISTYQSYLMVLWLRMHGQYQVKVDWSTVHPQSRLHLLRIIFQVRVEWCTIWTGHGHYHPCASSFMITLIWGPYFTIERMSVRYDKSWSISSRYILNLDYTYWESYF